jgi:hypothetical protein
MRRSGAVTRDVGGWAFSPCDSQPRPRGWRQLSLPAALGAVMVACAAAFLVGASSAAASTRRCRHGYARKTATHKRHGRKVRVVKCIKRRHKPTRRTGLPSTSSTASAPALAVHISPGLGRLPWDPLRADVAVSASASVSPLPEGGISVYVDGAGQCVVPVGAATSGGECLVSFSAIGAHRIEALYALGPSVTQTVEVREAITIGLEPLSVTTSTTVTDEAFASPQQECEVALVEAHKCDRLLLGRITVTSGRSPAGAEGSNLLVVNAPVCAWSGASAACGAPNGGWGKFVVYEWAEGSARGLVVDPSLPLETRAEHEGGAGAPWSVLEGGALTPGTAYQAHTEFLAGLPGYAAVEPATALTLLP